MADNSSQRDVDPRRDGARNESKLCEEIAEREGDRLTKLKDEPGASAAYRIAAAIRIRRNDHLEPF